VDWEKLRQAVELSTIFLDDVIQANEYVPAVPQLKKAAEQARRIGLGMMGLGDLMYHAGPHGSNHPLPRHADFHSRGKCGAFLPS
jgi:ribonucleotide reductase alpha subunit